MTIYKLGSIEPQLARNNDGTLDCWIAPSATVLGNVVLASSSSVWFGAVLRGDNETITVGEGSNVQDLAMLHTDIGFPLTIGANCTVGHTAILHGCTVGDNSLIGMGATVMNGTVIGKNCIIGAGALVPEGKTIPDNSLVLGSPGKVVKTLDDRAVIMLAGSAKLYQDNANRFRNELVAMDG